MYQRRRKAKAGSTARPLPEVGERTFTPEQVKTVERITTPILEEFYSD
jgi:hypothetical protein